MPSQASTASQPVSVPIGGTAHSGSAMQFFGHGSVGAEPFHSIDESAARGGFLSASAGTGAHDAGNGLYGGAQTQV